MAVPLACLYSLIIAAQFGTPGLALWAAFWAICVYRNASLPPRRQTNGETPSDAYSPRSP